MLAADKLQLQSSLKQQATALKEKEFNLHHNNFSEFRGQNVEIVELSFSSVYNVFMNFLHAFPTVSSLSLFSDRGNASSSSSWARCHDVY
mmetsp:Transcript_21941/g.44520  ORF Transcript_21941/g.44520 Transcript_21941/m.44520 type:complete len:90 (-) Transcript_21941:1189-1458(-)